MLGMIQRDSKPILSQIRALNQQFLLGFEKGINLIRFWFKLLRLG
jgi:hypothetical protein